MDGFTRILSLAKGGDSKAPCNLRIGKVKSPRPLQIETGGLVLNAYSIRLPPRLKAYRQGPEWVYPIDTGDTVLMVSQDDQIHYIVDKEVQP